MVLLIDAYNVIKMALGKAHIRDDERAQFVTDLSSYAKKKGLTIVAVFDGGPSLRAHEESTQRITVVYSGIKQSADDYIKQYLHVHKGRDILMVSSDRELAAWASQVGIPSLDAPHFYALMRAALKRTTGPLKNHTVAVKTSREEHGELDELMEESFVPPIHESVQPERKKESHQLSKVERQLLEKLKKL